MFRRSRYPTLLIALTASAACGDASPWDTEDWRPDRSPQRIVAASVLATEVLLEIAPRECLAGVHELAADPRYSLVADRIDGLALVGAAPEQLLAARPDLVIVDAFTRSETRALLRSADVPVVSTLAASDFAGIAENLRRIGSICHLEAPAEQLVQRMRTELAGVRAAAAEFADWKICSLDGALHTYGQGSLFDAVVVATGARNLAAAHGVGPYRKLDIETVLAWRPDAIVIGARADGEAGDRRWLEQYPGLSLLPCVARGRLLFVPGPLLGTTSHHLVDTARFVQDGLRKWGRP